jgi:phage-related protein
MAVELGAGYISTYPKLDEAKTRAATNDLENAIERAGDNAGRRAGDSFGASFGGGIKKAIGLAAAAFAGLQVGQYLKGAIDAASDLGETTSKVSQIFGSDALPALQDFAAGAAKSLGQSEQSALDAAATFGVFGKSAGLAGGDLAGFSTEMVTLASDLASFGNTSPEEAIEAIGSALRGESEPIRKYGVLLDDATLKNRALALGLISTTKDALTPQQKVLAAQAEILAQTSDAQGDFARTSGGLANQQRILAAQLANGKTALGELFLPAATAVVSFLVSKGIPALQSFTGAFKDTFSQIAGSVTGAAGFGETIAVEIGKAFGWTEDSSQVDKMATLFRTIQDGIAAGFFTMRDLVLAGSDAVVEAFSALTTGISNEDGSTAERIGLVIRDAFFLVRDGAREAYDSIVAVFDFVARHEDALVVAASALSGFAGSFAAIAAAQKAVSTISAVGEGAGLIAELLPLLRAHPVLILVAAIVAAGVAAYAAYKRFEPFRNVVDSVARTVRDVAVAAFERLRDIVAVVAPVVGEALRTAFDAVRTAIDAVRTAIDTVVTAISGMVSFFSGVASAVITALTPLVGWINDNLISTINAIFETVAATFQAIIDTIAPFVSTWIAILSPLLDFVSGLFRAIFDIVAEVLGLIFDVASEQLGNIIAGFQRFFDTIAPLVQATWDTIVTIVRTVFGVAKDVVESILGSIRGVFQTITGLISGDWSKIWEGINTILDSTLGNAIQIVSRILGGVRDTVSNILGGLAGVAREAIGDLAGSLYQAGRDLIGGLVDGIRDSIPSVREVLGGLTDLIPDLKGPAAVDKVLLFRSGQLILGGLVAGFKDMLPKVQAELGLVTNVVERTVVPAVPAASLVAPAPAAQQTTAPPAWDSGRWVVHLDGSELSRSFVRRERSGR